MRERRYVRAVPADWAGADLATAERQRDAIAKAIGAKPSLDDSLLLLQADGQVEAAKTRAAAVRMPPVNVLVLTLHPDDDAAREAKFALDLLSEYYDHQVDAFTGRPGTPEPGEKADKPVLSKLTPKEAVERGQTIAKVRVELDRLRRELFHQLLSDKHSKEEIDTIIGTCTAHEINMVMMAATRPDLLPSGSLPKPEKPPTADSKQTPS